MVELTNIQVSEGSVTEPVSLTEAKAWSQIDFTDHDSLLTSMIKGARKSIENFLNLFLVAKDVSLDFEFGGDCQKVITLPYCKGMSAVELNSLDDNDDETVLSNGVDYFIRGNTIRTWPGRYSVSYTTVPGTIPEDLKEAIKMEVAERYLRRGENNNESNGLSEAAKVKAMPYQILWL